MAKEFVMNGDDSHIQGMEEGEFLVKILIEIRQKSWQLYPFIEIRQKSWQLYPFTIYEILHRRHLEVKG